MPKEKQNKYDEKKLYKAIAYLCIGCLVMLSIMAYLSYKVDTSNINEVSCFGL